MPDTNRNQQKQLFLLILVFLLFVIVCAQAWRMLAMEHQLDTLNNSKLTLQLAIPQKTEKQAGTTKDTLTDNQQSPDVNEEPLVLIPPDDDDFTNNPVYPWVSNPNEDIRRMQQEMQNVFNDIDRQMYNPPEYGHHFRQHLSAPNINIREDQDQYRVTVNIPGVDAHEIFFKLNGQQLTVRAEQDYENESRNEAGNFAYREQRSGRFQRSILLREPVYPNAVRTHVDNGVLMIMIPKMRRQPGPQMR